jgi:hypothetical protein
MAVGLLTHFAESGDHIFRRLLLVHFARPKINQYNIPRKGGAEWRRAETSVKCAAAAAVSAKVKNEINTPTQLGKLRT